MYGTNLGKEGLMKKAKKRLHLMHDDKFIDDFIANSESLLGVEDEYIIHNRRNKNEVRFSKSNKTKVIHINSIEWKSLLKRIETFDLVYIHYLSLAMVRFVNHLPKNSKVVWVFYGADGFDVGLDYVNELYLPKTLKYLNRVRWFNYKLFNYPIIAWERVYMSYYVGNFKKAVKRISCFAHFIKEDYLTLKKRWSLEADFIEFSYGDKSLLEEMPEILPRKKQVNNILVGNSAAPSNNHIDLFYALKDRFPNSSIICPLTYSGTEGYIKFVTRKGCELFKSRFLPIQEHLDKERYKELLGSVAVAFMNHKRSQAMGNILLLLKMGAKILMRSESSAYRFLKEKGFYVFDLEEELKSSDLKILTPLSYDHVQRNRQLLNDYWGEENLRRLYRQLLLEI